MSADSSVNSNHLPHSFNDSSDSQILINNNNNKNNNNLFNRNEFIVKAPPSPNTSSESSRGYWPDHVLSGGPLIRRVTEGEEGSTASESDFDNEVTRSEDEMQADRETMESVSKSIGGSIDNRIEGSRRNTITNLTSINISRPPSASHSRLPTSINPFSSPTLQSKDSQTAHDSPNKYYSKRGELLSSIDDNSRNSSTRNRVKDHESSDTSRHHRSSKGKEKERRSTRTFNSSTLDPLDPLSSLRHPPSNLNSQSSSVIPRSSRIIQNNDLSNPLATSSTLSPNPDSSYVLSPPPPPQSLQQLLQTVDLSAALLLVQTLQKTQLQAQTAIPPKATLARLPSSDSKQIYNHERERTKSSTYFSDQTNAMSVSSADTCTPLLPPTSISPPPHSPVKFSHTNNLESSSRPRASTFLPISNAKDGVSEKKDRRRSLSFNFGASIMSKKPRIASISSSNGLPKVKERILEDRAHLGEEGRDFEEQIARVHLHLSPSTMRRAQNCSKYLSLRYSPVYAALSNSDLQLPNSLAVSRWKNEKEEAERRYRRTLVGTTGRSRGFVVSNKDEGIEFDGSRSIDGVRSEGGSSITGPLSKSLKASTNTAISVYGARRNKHPKAWEVYPDEISEFIETGGRISSPEVVKEMEGFEFGRAISARSTSIGSSYRQPLSITSNIRTPNQTVPSSPTSATIALPLSPSIGNFPARSRNISSNSGREGTSLSRSTTGRSSLEIASPSYRNNLSNSSLFQFPPQPTSSAKSPFTPTSSRVAAELTFEPLSPRVSISSKQNGSHTPTHSISKNQEGGRLRHSLTKRLDKIRGKGNEAEIPSDTGMGGDRNRRGSLPTEASESEMMTLKSSNVAESPTTGGNGSSFRRRTSKMNDEAGYRSSGGDENGKSSRSLVRGRWKPNKWQGFGGRNLGGDSEMVSLEEGVQLGAPLTLKKRVFRVEESEDDEYKPPREVLDFGDEEFSNLNAVLRQVRIQLSHIDSFLPRVPTQLNHYLESITQHDTSTFKSLNIPVQYPYPRLSASVISQLANRKLPQISPLLVSDRVATSSSPDNSSSSSSSSGNSDDENGKVSDKSVASIRFRPPRRDSQPRHVSGGHARRVTDPVSKGLPTGRARSQTLAGNVTGLGIGGGGGGGGGDGGTAIRGLTHPSGSRVDRLALLEKAIADLERGKKEVEAEIQVTMEFQEKVRKEITEFFVPVDRLISVMNSTYELKLQRVEKHFFRLNTSKTKSGFSVDILWGLLSYVITFALLLFWAIATIWNLFYGLVKSPFVFLRWLLYPF